MHRSEHPPYPIINHHLGFETYLLCENIGLGWEIVIWTKEDLLRTGMYISLLKYSIRRLNNEIAPCFYTKVCFATLICI